VKVKLDENLGALAVRLFDVAGHDVATVRMQQLHGAPDRRIYDACREEARLLVTLDLDFANPFRFDPAPTAGIAVIRVPTMPGLRDLEDGVRRLVAELEKLPVKGRLWIVGRERVREFAPETPDSDR
jgi:predicted nuclease of predicted toxin-antitoxin system